jgi:nucleolar MIF4G domain-containing protein 1
MKELAGSEVHFLNNFVEYKIELLECLINHCGSSIGSDDPMNLKSVISILSNQFETILRSNHDEIGGENSSFSNRLRFMLESLTDLKNNKSRRIQTFNSEIVNKLRKWLGTIKKLLGQKSGDLCLRVSMQDILDVENRGRL